MFSFRLKKVGAFALPLLALLFLSACSNTQAKGKQGALSTTPSCGKVVSLAPSITEVLYALGLGDSVAGVTRYCDYPPNAQSKPKIGGYYDPNYEEIAIIGPDHIFLLEEHERPRELFKKMGIKTTSLSHKELPGIFRSIALVGESCGREVQAEKLKKELLERIEIVKKKVAGAEKRRVMVTIGRAMGTGSISSLYVAGRGGLYDRLIELAGGVNAFRNGGIRFPALSVEGVLSMNPQIIIDMVPNIDKMGWKREDVLAEWNKVPAVDAVRNGEVYVFGENYGVIPGPRFILLLEKMAAMIHPERFSQGKKGNEES